ncbi:hypothetical protein KQI48_15215 [Cellulomonas hominis]|uniref:hypothetical protein n=1 Tax=Cellulomonas hominis TaxID=156981 RepID=UPI001C11DD1F|nr:hypothetical protein [Cellulomonas hominis]MBU5424017.1 hypothetical protein [Cellulomonas hominis]
MRPHPAPGHHRGLRRAGRLPLLLLAVALLATACSDSGARAGDAPSTSAAMSDAPRPTASATAPAPTTSASADAGTDAGTDPGADPGAQPADPPASAEPAPAGGLSVVITFAEVVQGALEVGSYVEGTIEDGGTCALSARSGSTTRDDDHEGVADATTTSCGTLSVPASSGTWKVTVSYDSPSGRGQASTTVVVP